MSFKIDYIPDIMDNIAPKMVDAGMRILEPDVRRNMESAIKEGTGQLKKSQVSPRYTVTSGVKAFDFER